VRFLESLGTFLRTAVAVAALPIAIFVYSLAAIGLALAGARPARIHAVYVSICQFCLLVGGTRLLVRGVDRIGPGQPYVVVVNHEGNWDPLCLIAGLPGLVLRFVAKRQFMDIPVLGQALRLTGNVRVVRSETRGDTARIRTVMAERDPEVSILFFAEGRRSRDGALHPFKLGAFATALGYGLPILPIAVAGTRPIWLRGTLRIRQGTVAIEIGEPISTRGLGYEDRHALRDRAFETVQTLRTRARERLRELGVDPGGID
jgi:1-acyl-sn-glycerol-3-phosphate acyltransferase